MPNGLAGSAQVSYPLVAPSGTAGAPSFSFAASPTSGMYLASAGVVGFSGAATFGSTVTATGQVRVSDGTIGAPGIAFSSDLATGFGIGSGRIWIKGTSSVAQAPFAVYGSNAGFALLASDCTLAWCNAGADVGAPDLALVRDAANVLAQRNSTNAQEFRVYGTYADASNYERLAIVTGAAFEIQVQAAGTGVGKSLQLKAGSGAAFHFGGNGAVQWNVSASGHLLAGADNTYDIGANGATRPRDLFLGRNMYAVTAYLSGLGDGSARVASGFFGGNTPAASAPMIDCAQTWNDGAVAFVGANFDFTDTASAAGAILFRIRGGASGTSDRLVLGKNGDLSVFGTVFGYAAYLHSSGYVQFGTNGFLQPASNGVWGLYDNAGTSFARLCFGGTTAAFPAIARDGANLSLVHADGSAGYIDLTVHDVIGSSVYLSNLVGVGANNTNIGLSLTGFAMNIHNSSAALTLAVTGGATLATFAGTGYLEMYEVTAPSAPSANTGRIYFEDNGAGKTRLMCLFATGASQQLAIEP